MKVELEIELDRAVFELHVPDIELVERSNRSMDKYVRDLGFRETDLWLVFHVG
jgi:hypothetical protein